MHIVIMTHFSKRLSMARIGLTVVLLTLLSPSLLAAPANVCDSVEFTTQAQVDAFDQGCTVIDGSLTVRGNDIRELSHLSNIEQVDSLKILATGQLKNLSGLDTLATVTQCVLIQENVVLSSLTGLEKLSVIGGEPNLGAGCVLGLGLYLNWNSELTDVNGLKALSSITGSLSIFNNDSLQDVRGLAALNNVVLDTLEIRDNAVLPHLNGLEGLWGADRLFIRYNTRMIHVDALKNLQYTSATPASGRKFEVSENWRLARCEGLALFFRWPGREFLRGSAWFEDNETGCETLDELWASVVMTAPEVSSLSAANGRMTLEFAPATINTDLYPISGHRFGCVAVEIGAASTVTPLTSIPNGQTINERRYFSSELRDARQGVASRSYAAWTPVFQVWHPSPDELTATLTTPWGEELLLLDRFGIDPGDDNRFSFPENVYAAIEGTVDQERVFPSGYYFREVNQELGGWYEISFSDSVVTATGGRLSLWGIEGYSELEPNQIPVQGTTIHLDTVLNEVEYQCHLYPEIALSAYRSVTELEFTSELGLPQSAPEIISVTPQADGEASILVEFSQPWAWQAELQDYLVTCEAEGEEPAYGYALADNGDANQVMAADGSVSQAILVEGVSEEVEYACSVRGYNRRGGGPASGVANVTTEAVIRGLPIWLLYEATRSP